MKRRDNQLREHILLTAKDDVHFGSESPGSLRRALGCARW